MAAAAATAPAVSLSVMPVLRGRGVSSNGCAQRPAARSPARRSRGHSPPAGEHRFRGCAPGDPGLLPAGGRRPVRTGVVPRSRQAPAQPACRKAKPQGVPRNEMASRCAPNRECLPRWYSSTASRPFLQPPAACTIHAAFLLRESLSFDHAKPSVMTTMRPAPMFRSAPTVPAGLREQRLVLPLRQGWALQEHRSPGAGVEVGRQKVRLHGETVTRKEIAPLLRAFDFPRRARGHDQLTSRIHPGIKGIGFPFAQRGQGLHHQERVRGIRARCREGGQRTHPALHPGQEVLEHEVDRLRSVRPRGESWSRGRPW